MSIKWILPVVLLMFIHLTSSADITKQKTVLDRMEYRDLFHVVRNFFFNMIGPSGKRTKGNYFQKPFPPKSKFPCDLQNSRSPTRPTSIHKLRPGDIDVIAAMGDSVTAASGAASSDVLEVFMENRGLSWSIGGQWDWKNATTLANILKAYNPNLVGYSYNDSLPFHKGAQFNLAEIGASSSDMPFMAKALIKRIKLDKRVNFNEDWKMVTLLIGGNDICSYMCSLDDINKFPEKHRSRLLRTMRNLKDGLPRTFVNLVSIPLVDNLLNSPKVPNECRFFHKGECSCWFGNLYNQSSILRKKLNEIQKEIIAVEKSVTLAHEFRNLEEFAVVYQPWSLGIEVLDKNGHFDKSLVAVDCFHLSQKGNAWAGTALYNNLLEPAGEKTEKWHDPRKHFKCPTKENPYMFTYENSAMFYNEKNVLN